MNLIQKIPWWGWVIAIAAVLLLYGEATVKVGNLRINGVDMGGYDSEKGHIPPKGD